MSDKISRSMIPNQQQSSRWTTFAQEAPEPPRFASHVENRLEAYYESEAWPNDNQKVHIASNLGIDVWHVEVRAISNFVSSFTRLTSHRHGSITGGNEQRLPGGSTISRLKKASPLRRTKLS